MTMIIMGEKYMLHDLCGRPGAEVEGSLIFRDPEGIIRTYQGRVNFSVVGIVTIWREGVYGATVNIPHSGVVALEGTFEDDKGNQYSLIWIPDKDVREALKAVMAGSIPQVSLGQ